MYIDYVKVYQYKYNETVTLSYIKWEMSHLGFDVIDAGRVFNKLMTRLGHDRYYVQGGDWGGIISRFMAAMYGR